MKNNPNNLIHGQKLWYVTRDAKFQGEVTVTKIGRKWAYITALGIDLRIDIDTWYVDGNGYAPPGRCFISQDDYEVFNDRGNAWRTLCKKMKNKFQCPEGVTLEDIRQAATLLKLNISITLSYKVFLYSSKKKRRTHEDQVRN